MNEQIIVSLVGILLAGLAGLAVTAVTNKGCTHLNIESKSIVIGSFTGFMLGAMFFLFDLFFLKYTGATYVKIIMPFSYFFLGAIGGLVGHAWHENWEMKNGDGNRVHDLGLSQNTSPEQIREARKKRENDL